MSRVGRTIIKIPTGVKVEIVYGYDQKRMISVTGPNGVLVQEIKDHIWVELTDTEVQLKRENDEPATLNPPEPTSAEDGLGTEDDLDKALRGIL